MEGHRLIFNDGSTCENGHAGASGGLLWLWLPDMQFWDACDLARDADKMRRIVFQYGDMQDTFEGFTTCTGILDDTGEISVRMVKGE